MNTTTNYYGSLCTKMYELLHPVADEKELDFYLSFADKNMQILEPMCGSGRFMNPFIEKGYSIEGFDLSKEMIIELLKKKANAKAVHSGMQEYQSDKKFDYIFIASSSFSLFLSDEEVRESLKKTRSLLKDKGFFVFGVEAKGEEHQEIKTYTEHCREKTKEGYDLLLKIKQHYDTKSKILHMPNLYELYKEERLLQSEKMDFRIRLYEENELESFLEKAGFKVQAKHFSYNMSEEKKKELIIYVCK